MNFEQREHEENNPYLQLLILAGYAAAGALLSSLIGIVIVFSMYGSAILDPAALAGGDPKFIAGLKILQICVFLGLFLGPPLLLAVTEKRKINVFYQFKRPQWNLLLAVFLIMVLSMPLMELIALVNQKMVLPEALKPLEEWMRRKEDEAMEMTYLFLTMKTVTDFLVNIFMIALLPGICEELMFRGAIQRSLSRIFSNPHVAIWVAAFIFSFIHLQFYGFFPRLLLGAAFGYIYFWSGNLWYAMLAHFLNNAYAVCVAWYLQQKNIPLNDESVTMEFQWYGYAISLVLTAVLFIYFKNKSKAEYGEQLD